MRLRYLPLDLAMFSAAVLCAAACTSAPIGSSPGVVNVVAGENFWGSIASQLGGPHVRVTSIVSDPNADPHLYETSASDAAAVAQARLAIENGAGYDDFVTKLLAAAGGSNRTVINVQNVLHLTGPDVNPHFWYDIPRVPEVASAIEVGLARVDPKDAASFHANLATFDSALQPITAVLGLIHQRHAGAPVAYTERVPQYLLLAAGLDVKTPAGFASAIENGNDPSPGDTALMDQLVTGHQVAVLLYNAQTVSATTQNVRRLAAQVGVPVVPVTETLPPSYRTYQAWQLGQAQAILRALGG